MSTIMLSGRRIHTIDKKGRVIIPADFRTALGEQCTLTVGFERCLCLYPDEKWHNILENLNSMSQTSSAGRKLNRVILGNAELCRFDTMGRILIPQHLIEWAQIDKEVVLVGQGERIEVWDKCRWDEMCSPETLDTLNPEELKALESLEL